MDLTTPPRYEALPSLAVQNRSVFVETAKEGCNGAWVERVGSRSSMGPETRCKAASSRPLPRGRLTILSSLDRSEWPQQSEFNA